MSPRAKSAVLVHKIGALKMGSKWGIFVIRRFVYTRRSLLRPRRLNLKLTSEPEGPKCRTCAQNRVRENRGKIGAFWKQASRLYETLTFEFSFLRLNTHF